MNQSHQHVYTIDASVPFLGALIDGVYERFGDDPFALANITILLPTRRACRELEVLFASRAGGVSVLPKLVPISNELSDSAPVISDTKRLYLFQRWLQDWFRQTERRELAAPAARELAESCVQLWSMLVRDDIEPSTLADELFLDVSDELATTIAMLRDVFRHYTSWLEEQHCADNHQVRIETIRALAAHYEQQAPEHPVILAGTTASVPATRELAAVLMQHEHGYVILPGLDKAQGEVAEAHHPQYRLQQTLAALGVNEVPLWSGSESPSVWTEVMAPASEFKVEHPLDNVHLLSCQDEDEEALNIALLLKYYAEERIALVTNNRELKRRVKFYLARFGVQLNDSEGEPLSETLAGGLWLRMMNAVVQASVSDLLELLHHPLMAHHDAHQAIDKASRDVLVSKGSPFATLKQKLKDESAIAQLEQLEATLTAEKPSAAFSEHISALLGAFGTIIEGAEHPSVSLVVSHVESLLSSDMAGERVPLNVAVQLLASSIENTVCRSVTDENSVPALTPIEARMLAFDKVVLARLNQGSWPSVERTPLLPEFLSAKLGVQSPAAYQGLSAHDFVGCASVANEVFITRACNQQGEVTEPAPWWNRLQVVQGEAVSHWVETLASWRHYLLHNLSRVTYSLAEPSPALEQRPTRFSATAVETLMQNPYRYYAKYILKLRELDARDAPIDMKHIGTRMHRVLEQFVLSDVRDEQALEQAIEGEFGWRTKQDARYVPWLVALDNIRPWILDMFADYAPRESLTEYEMEVEMTLSSGVISLQAEADRIDVDEAVTVVDYKTGAVPSKKEVQLGLKPQLLVEAWIWSQLRKEPVETLNYTKLAKRESECKVTNIEFSDELRESSLQGLVALFEHFVYSRGDYTIIDEERDGDAYRHLSRVQEVGT